MRTHSQIQKEICEKIQQILKLQEEIHWLAKERDSLKKNKQ